jgi:hypothetical protein
MLERVTRGRSAGFTPALCQARWARSDTVDIALNDQPRYLEKERGFYFLNGKRVGKVVNACSRMSRSVAAPLAAGRTAAMTQYLARWD